MAILNLQRLPANFVDLLRLVEQNAYSVTYEYSSRMIANGLSRIGFSSLSFIGAIVLIN